MCDSVYVCAAVCMCLCACVCVCVEKLFIKLFNNIEHVMTVSWRRSQVYFIFYGCCDCQKEKPFNKLFNFLTSESML